MKPADNAIPLSVDAAVDLVLGILLMVFPRGVIRILGLPLPDTPFYPSILGAVLVGIGLSLVVERFRGILGVTGLSLFGALVINFLGAGTLIWWLVNGGLRLPLQGYIVLWILAIALVSIGVAEVLMQFRR